MKLKLDGLYQWNRYLECIKRKISVSGASVQRSTASETCLHLPISPLTSQVVQCLAAYLTNPLLNTDELAQSQLLATIFQILVSICLFKKKYM